MKLEKIATVLRDAHRNGAPFNVDFTHVDGPLTLIL